MPPAAAAAERLLVATGDWERCADLLAWQVARAARCRLAGDESDRGGVDSGGWPSCAAARLGQSDEALRLYSPAGRARPAAGPAEDPPELRRCIAPRADAGDRHRARAGRADRRPSARGRWSIARTLFAERAAPPTPSSDALARPRSRSRATRAVLAALERLYEGEAGSQALADELGDARPSCRRSRRRPLHFGRGRAAERAGRPDGRARGVPQGDGLDPTLAEPLAALSALAAREGDWNEVATLLEGELGRATSAKRKGPLLLELAIVHGDRLKAPARALALLETAATFLPGRAAPLRSQRAVSISPPATGRRRPRRSTGWRRAAPRSPTPPRGTTPSARPPRRRGRSIARSPSTRGPTGATTATGRRSSGWRRSASSAGSGTTPGRRPRRCSSVTDRRWSRGRGRRWSRAR